MAVETSADLLNQLKQEVGFSVSGGDATLLGWLNARHRKMVARSKCYRGQTTIAGGTVIGQADYAIPSGALRIQSVEVGGVTYDRASRSDVIAVRNSTAVFTSEYGEGVVALGAGAAGAETLTIYPTPTVAGASIVLFGALRAPELTVAGVGTPPAGATNSPVVPPEYFDALVNGAAAIGLKRTESRHGEAQAYTSEFDDACEELRRETRARWNTGPSRIRVEWPA
jgi:hypothetical protein